MRQFVDYCQYQVRSAPYWRTGMPIYLVGDELLHVSSPTECTGFAATHTGWIEMRVVVRDAPPAEGDPVGDADDWDAISETTLWSPQGVLSVHSMMGSTAEEFAGLSVPPGLIRLRAHARNLIHESVRTDDDPPEQHQLLVWPVTEDVGPRTRRAAGTRREWEQKRAKAAEYAMLDVIRPYDTHEERDPDDLPRVAVVRRRPAEAVPVLPDRLPVGDLEVHLTPTAEGTLSWRWASTTEELPDQEASTVRLAVVDGELTLRHEGVTGRHAILLGLVWDHLLDDPAGRPAWEPVLRAQAAEKAERAERNRRLRAEHEANSWGGTPPTDRLRALTGQALSFARLDRPLLDRLAELPADRQRQIAVWAARRAMRVAGMEQIGWIAEALAAVEAGERLPAAFTDDHGQAVSRRLYADPAIPHTVIKFPGGPSNFRQQSVAFPALLALADDDPLAAVIDAVYTAATAHGEPAHLAFLAEVPRD
ncbi:hypothetical protein GCM10010172_78600 [Paractinoplanes ferrugineus]|uniref:Uncharacterized protein n=1 Tax=Paractinoplanes ferrugineus TaxID=113564 RepID=A0A919MEM4_9ACTN|nr:hypothetical protein Afe05nite_47730 [Actinoplanes ferrugineus]